MAFVLKVIIKYVVISLGKEELEGRTFPMYNRYRIYHYRIWCTDWGKNQYNKIINIQTVRQVTFMRQQGHLPIKDATSRCGRTRRTDGQTSLAVPKLNNEKLSAYCTPLSNFNVPNYSTLSFSGLTKN